MHLSQAYIHPDTASNVWSVCRGILIWGFVVISSLFVLVMLFPFEDLKRHVTKVDMFAAKHMHPAGPVWQKKTYTGGLCTLFYMSFSLILIAALVIKFMWDNDAETISLVPRLSYITEKFSSNFTLIVTQLGYKGNCLGNGTQASKDDSIIKGFVKCPPHLKVSVAGLNPQTTLWHCMGLAFVRS